MLTETISIQNNQIENPNTACTVNLFEHLPMAVLNTSKGDLHLESLSKSIGEIFNVPLQAAQLSNSENQITIADIIKSKLAPEDQAAFDEKGYERLKEKLNEMEVGEAPYTHIEVTPNGEMEVRYRKIPGQRILFEMNPIREHSDSLTGFHERDVFERRARRLNKFQTDPDLPERLRPVTPEHPLHAFFADANHLKKVNDGLGGHLAGNAYLLGIATALKIGAFGLDKIYDDIAIKNFIEDPDNGVYRKLFEQILTPEFWGEFESIDELNDSAFESTARTMMKMPDEIYRIGGDEFMGFINNQDIIKIRKRICNAVNIINNAIRNEAAFKDKLPQLSFAIACARTNGKTIQYVKENEKGDFYLADTTKNFSTFSNLEHDMDTIMYEHKRSIKLKEMLGENSSLLNPSTWDSPLLSNEHDPYKYNDRYYKELK